MEVLKRNMERHGTLKLEEEERKSHHESLRLLYEHETANNKYK